MKNFSFKKAERLTDKRQIAALFKSGKSVSGFPLKMVYLPVDECDTPTKVVIAVPKRNFKHAVARNLLKRRIREAYRLHKPELYEMLAERNQKLHLLIIYIGKEEFPYKKIEDSLTSLFKKLTKKLL